MVIDAARRATAAAVLLAMASAPAPGPAQQRFYGPEDRILVGDGGIVHAVAAGPFDVFAASDFGILVFDATGERWKPPLPLPPDLAGARPSALAFDPAGGTLWIGSTAGTAWTTTPGFERWDRLPAATPGPVDAIVPWPLDGAVYLHASGEWLRIDPGSLVPTRSPADRVPPGVRTAARSVRDDPRFRAASGTLGLDPRGHRWPITDAAAGREPGEIWIGTRGGGLIRYDTRTGSQQWYRYGLAGGGVGAIAWLDGTLWFGGDGRDGRGGVAWTDPDMAGWGQQFRDDGAPAGFVAEMIGFAGATWFAAEDGLFRLAGRPSGGRRGEWRRLGSADGLASDRVRSLAVAGGLLWVGTDRGLTPLDSAGAPIRGPLVSGQRVSRLAVSGDTLLYIASDRGVQSLAVPTPSAAVNARPVVAGRSAALRGRTPDLVVEDSLMYVIAGNAVIDAGGAGLPERAASLDRIGPPLRLALRDGRLWVAGPRGIASRDPGTGQWRAFLVPQDVHAGPVVDVVAVDDFVWAATPAGGVRLRWR